MKRILSLLLVLVLILATPVNTSAAVKAGKSFKKATTLKPGKTVITFKGFEGEGFYKIKLKKNTRYDITVTDVHQKGKSSLDSKWTSVEVSALMKKNGSYDYLSLDDDYNISFDVTSMASLEGSNPYQVTSWFYFTKSYKSDKTLYLRTYPICGKNKTYQATIMIEEM